MKTKYFITFFTALFPSVCESSKVTKRCPHALSSGMLTLQQTFVDPSQESGVVSEAWTLETCRANI